MSSLPATDIEMPLVGPPTMPLGAPFPEAVYADPTTIKAALQQYVREQGYAILVDSSTPLQVFYICSKGGKYRSKGKDPSVHQSRQRRNTSTMKTDCPYKVVAQHQDDGWLTT